jgi:hypothetical protein
MGFKNLVLDYSLAKDFGLVVLNATFFFPKGEFEIKTQSVCLLTKQKLIMTLQENKNRHFDKSYFKTWI